MFFGERVQLRRVVWRLLVCSNGASPDWIMVVVGGVCCCVFLLRVVVLLCCCCVLCCVCVVGVGVVFCVLSLWLFCCCVVGGWCL